MCDRHGISDREVLFTAGLGDVFAMDAWICPEYRKKVKRVYWATTRSRQLIPLFQMNPEWSHVEHVDLTEGTKWETAPHWGMFTLVQVEREFGVQLRRVDDLGITLCFMEIESGHPNALKRWKWHGSSFNRHTFADVSHLGLPEKYAVCQPYTVQHKEMHQRVRAVAPNEWPGIRRVVEAWDMPLVVVNVGAGHIPDWVDHDLTDRLSLPEAIEVCKGAKAYIGIDSCFSVLLSELLAPPYFQVRGQTHSRQYRMCYYPARTEPDREWIVQRLGPISPAITKWEF